MTKLLVEADRYEYVTQEADPEDSWDRDDTAADISTPTVRVAPPGDNTRSYGMYDEAFEVEGVRAGDTVIVVYADYDSGDTFGRSGNQCTILDVFPETVEESQVLKFVKALEHCREFSLTFGGKNYYIPYVGYFESLNSINADHVVVQNA